MPGTSKRRQLLQANASLGGAAFAARTASGVAPRALPPYLRGGFGPGGGGGAPRGSGGSGDAPRALGAKRPLGERSMGGTALVSWYGSRSRPSSISSFASPPQLLAEGGWPFCFSWSKIEGRWVVSRADDDKAVYLFKEDGSKVCDGLQPAAESARERL